jgi:hypothetical protein
MTFNTASVEKSGTEVKSALLDIILRERKMERVVSTGPTALIMKVNSTKVSFAVRVSNILLQSRKHTRANFREILSKATDGFKLGMGLSTKVTLEKGKKKALELCVGPTDENM